MICININPLNLDVLAFVNTIQGLVFNQCIYVSLLDLFNRVEFQNVFFGANVRGYFYVSGCAIPYLFNLKLNLKVICIYQTYYLFVFCDSYSNFEVISVKVESKGLVNAVGGLDLSYRSISISHHHLKSITCEGRDCNVDQQCDDCAKDRIY